MTKAIQKSVEIPASPARVWEVLTQDRHTRNWYAEFSPGSHAQTDWKEGSKAIFTDDSSSGNGLVGIVTESRPGEKLSLEYHSMLVNGREDKEMSERVKGTRESYTLSGDDTHTRLDIYCDMDEEYFDSMSGAWDRALQKIKELAVNG